MLGKLIKNEFVQRGPQVGLVYAGMLVASLFFSLMRYLIEDVQVKGTVPAIIFIISMVTFIAGICGGSIGNLTLAFLDYNKRFFKDQGYLTHTLPVKTSTMLFARMVFDVVLGASMVITIPFCISIGFGDFQLYEELFDFIVTIFKDANRVSLIMISILAIITFFLSSLISMWQYYSAYAVGHSFSKCKKIASIISYIAIYFILFMGVTLVEKISRISFVRKVLEDIAAALRDMNYVNIGVIAGFIVADLALILVIFLLACVTNYICKRRLNLE